MRLWEIIQSLDGIFERAGKRKTTPWHASYHCHVAFVAGSAQAVAPEQSGRLLTVERSLRVTRQQPLLNLGAAPLSEATIFTIDGHARGAQRPNENSIVLGRAAPSQTLPAGRLFSGRA